MEETKSIGLALIINGFLHIPWIIVAWIYDYKFWSILYIPIGILFVIYGYKIFKIKSPNSSSSNKFSESLISIKEENQK